MQFTNGAQVFAASGDELGRITHVVLDPTRKTVTHIVIRQGILFVDDKLVPIDLIASADPEGVNLRVNTGEVKSLPPLFESYYAPVDPAHVVADVALAMDGWYLEPYTETIPNGSGRSEFQYMRREKETIPANTVALEGGARVISADGHHVGAVESVLTQGNTDYAAHVVIVSGLLVKLRRILPTAWFQFVEADSVYLSVEAARLETLPEYH